MMTIPDIKEILIAEKDRPYNTRVIQPVSLDLKDTWEKFIDSLLREYKTLNIISVLLLSAILSTLQIDAAGGDPVIRSAALLSLICALMSLLYGCMYIIRFGTMKETHKALMWAKESRDREMIFWNVWILLAMPAAWLAWSIILYLVCIMAFVWRTDAANATHPSILPRGAVIGPRVAISTVLGLGVLYFCLIINTFRKYGVYLDDDWERTVAHWRRTPKSSFEQYHSSSRYSRGTRDYSFRPSASATTTIAIPDRSSSGTLFPSAHAQLHTGILIPAKIFDLRLEDEGKHLLHRGIKREDWERFISETYRSWNKGIFRQGKNRGVILPQAPDLVAGVIETWNKLFFMQRGARAFLCEEHLPGFPDSHTFAIYLIDLTSSEGLPLHTFDRSAGVPEGREHNGIIGPPRFMRPEEFRSKQDFSSPRTVSQPREGHNHYHVPPPDRTDVAKLSSESPVRSWTLGSVRRKEYGRKMSRSPINIEEVPHDPPHQNCLRQRHRATQVPPPIVIHPPMGKDPRSRPLKGGARQRDSNATLRQSGPSLYGHRRGNSNERSGGGGAGGAWGIYREPTPQAPTPMHNNTHMHNNAPPDAATTDAAAGH